MGTKVEITEEQLNELKSVFSTFGGKRTVVTEKYLGSRTKNAEEINFKLEYGISKKGNKTITVIQIPTDDWAVTQSHGFSALQKYKTVVKIKTIAHFEYFKEYLDKTIEEVFEIAFKSQNWKLIPFNPICIIESYEATVIHEGLGCDLDD